jgi:hypothetical protein
VDRTGSGSCPMVSFSITGAADSASRVLEVENVLSDSFLLELR